MFSHVTVGVADLERAARFYDALLTPLGLRQRDVSGDAGPPSRCWAGPGGAVPCFYTYSPFDGKAASVGNGSMVAFAAAAPALVDAAYAGGMAQGGTDEGAPGERLHYGKGYYGAYLRDPDGNKIHIVHRGDLVVA